LLRIRSQLSNYFLFLSLYNSAGQLLTSTNLRIADNGRASIPNGLTALDTPFEASELGRAYRKAHSTRGQIDPPLNETLVEAFTNPAGHDILEGDACATTLRLAKTNKLNVIVALPDRAAEVDFITEPTTLAAATGNLCRYVTLRLAKEQGWLTGKPQSIAQVQSENYPRAALCSILTDTRRTGFVGFSHMLAHQRLCAFDSRKVYVGVLFELSFPGLINIIDIGAGNAEAWALVANLNSRQLQDAGQGITIPFATLTPEQRQIVERRVFENDDNRFLWSEKNGQFVNPDDSPAILREPSVALPDGLPKNGCLRITLVASDTVFGSINLSGTGRFYDETGPVSVARAIVSAEKNSEYGYIPTGYKDGKSYELEVVYDFGVQGYIKENSRYWQMSRTSKPYEYAKLPKKFRDSVDELVKDLRSRFGG